MTRFEYDSPSDAPLKLSGADDKVYIMVEHEYDSANDMTARR